MQQGLNAIGVDLGSHKSVIALAQDTIVEVLLNDGSSRETPNVIGFKDNERFIGEQGYQQMQSNFLNTVKYFTRFLACQTHPQLNELERLHVFCKTVDQNGKITFEIDYEGKTTVFSAEQLTASFLSVLLKKFKQPIFMSYPDYYTDQDKFCLLESCDIGEINIQGFISQSEAIMYDYGYFRREEFETQRTVLFIDIGQCNFNAFVADFTQNKSYKVAHVFDRNCGGRDLDTIVLNHFWSQIQVELVGLQEQQIKKTKMRLLGALEKLRLNLSSNSESQLNVECLIKDFDLIQKVERAEYEKIIKPFINKVVTLLLELKNQTLQSNIHSIEILGGITRIPSIQLAIQSIFPHSKLSKTLNATESISRGCALHGVLTKNIDNNYQVLDLVHHPIKVGWIKNSQIKSFWNIEKCEDDLSNIFPKGQSFQLFGKMQFTKSKTFEVIIDHYETLEFTIFYEPRLQGYHSAIKQYQVMRPQEQISFDTIKVTFGQNQFQQIVMISAQAFFQNRLVDDQLNLYMEVLEEDNLNEMQVLQQREKLMKRQDSTIREFHQIKYNLESLIYKTRDDLNCYLTALDQGEKDSVTKKLLKVEEWMYDESEEKTEEMCTQCIERLNMELQPYYRIQSKFMFK